MKEKELTPELCYILVSDYLKKRKEEESALHTGLDREQIHQYYHSLDQAMLKVQRI